MRDKSSKEYNRSSYYYESLAKLSLAVGRLTAAWLAIGTTSVRVVFWEITYPWYLLHDSDSDCSPKYVIRKKKIISRVVVQGLTQYCVIDVHRRIELTKSIQLITKFEDHPSRSSCTGSGRRKMNNDQGMLA